MGTKKFKCVGLIIRDRSLSAVEVESNKNGPTITNYSKILLEEGIVANGCVILNKESFQEAIKKLMVDGIGGPMKTNDVLISLPEEKVFSHEVEIPKERINDVDFIKGAAKDFIPIELNKAVFDYKIACANRDDKTITLDFVATQDTIAQSITKALEDVRLNVIGMNVDINCFVRSFGNEINQTEGDFLLIGLNIERDIFAVSSEKEGVTKLICKADKTEMIDKIKALFSLSTTDEVQQFLVKLKQGEGLSEEQKVGLKNSFKEYLENLSAKIKQVITAAESKEPVEIHTIYLTGILSGLPGIEETIASLLPEITIKKSVQYTDIPAEIEEDALQGIGLCLGNSVGGNKSCFNLLPQNRKDEINLAKVSPKLKTLSVILAALLMIFNIQMGLKTAKSYLSYRISSQEVAIYNEQALNPYVTQIARIKQQKKQNEEQILSLINDALPVSNIISHLDSHNKNGVTMVNITYNEAPTLNTSDLSVRARTANRNETEKFIKSLEESPLYTAIESPLSNLVGKGERFISVGLSVDKESIIEAYKAQFESAMQDSDSPNESITNDEDNA